MNRYEVTVRTDSTFIVEAKDLGEAASVGLESADDRYCGRDCTRSVLKIVDLTGDPIDLLEELAMELEAVAFQNDFCRYCAGPGPRARAHSVDCIIERARYCIREHRRKADENHTD